MKLDLDRLPSSLTVQVVTKPIGERIVKTPEEVARLAGYTPALPPPSFFPDTSKLAVVGRLDAQLSLSVAELQASLQRAGASEFRVPPEWDGVKLGIHVQAIVVANYADDTTLMQFPPISLSAPAGFALHELVEIAFRILGMDSVESRRMARRFAANPSWFLGVPQEDSVGVREVALRSGTGMLIEDFDDSRRSERTALLWSAANRTFILSGELTADRAVAIANTTSVIYGKAK